MINRVLLFTFAFISCSFFAQERTAKLVFIDGETVEGLGEIKDDKIYFRLTEKDKVEVWDNELVKGLTFFGYGNTERYEFVLSDKYDEIVVMEVIEEGLVSLYREMDAKYSIQPGFYLGPNGNERGVVVRSEMADLYFVKKNEMDKAVQLTTFGFKKKALKIFADCEDVVEMINDNDFTQKDILDMVSYYNKNCGK